METKKKQSPDHIGLVRNDSWLEPFEAAIRGRHDHAVWKINQLTKNGKKTLSDFASGHLYFGLHKLTTILLATLTIGRKTRSIVASVLLVQVIGNLNFQKKP